jgi:hypothetical protein
MACDGGRRCNVPSVRCAYEFVRDLKLAVTHADTHVSERGRVGLWVVSKAHAPTTRPTQKQQHASHSGYLSARLLSYRSVPSFLSLAASVRSDVSRSWPVLAMVDISASRSPLVVPSWACRLSVSSMTMRLDAAGWHSPHRSHVVEPTLRLDLSARFAANRAQQACHSSRGLAGACAWSSLSCTRLCGLIPSIPMHG